MKRGGIPLINFKKCGLLVEENELRVEDLAKTGKELYDAFSKYGFAYISNPGITREQVDEINDISGQFFALPLDEKMKYCTKSLTIGGYDPTGYIKVSAKRNIDFQEAFRITGETWEDGVFTWPDLPNHKEKHAEFMELCKHLEMRALKALGMGMKLKDPDYFCKCHRLINKRGNMTTLATLRYPPIYQDQPLLENQIRLGEHTDSGSLTLLFQDYEIGGLQVRNEEGEFENAPPIPGTVVLNVGDALSFWSGEKLKSTYHRVMPVGPDIATRARRSIVYFGIPDDEALLEELEFEDTAETPGSIKEQALTAAQYLEKRFTQLYKYQEKS